MVSGEKYHAPKLQMLAKMQSLCLKHCQNAISCPLKVLRFSFSFSKATKSFGVLFAISQSVGKKCQDLLCVELGGKGDCCQGTALGLGALALYRAVRETTWVIPRTWDEALQNKE